MQTILPSRNASFRSFVQTKSSHAQILEAATLLEDGAGNDAYIPWVLSPWAVSTIDAPFSLCGGLGS